MSFLLRTARLTLRPLRESDVDNLVDLDADPEVMRFIGGGRAKAREVIRDEVLPRMLGYDARPPGYGFWAAESRSADVFLGWFELRPSAEHPPGEVELGYRLHRTSWGMGYATEGAQALVRTGFTDLGVRRVLAQTMTVNSASRRVMAKVGLRLVRTFHDSWHDPVEGAEHGDVEYALTRQEWASRRSSPSESDGRGE